MTDDPKFQTSPHVRRHLIDALRADLVGPFWPEGSEEEEVWDIAPSKRYLCGFLVPNEQSQLEPDPEDDPNDEDGLEAGDDPSEGSQNDREAQRRPLLPSSMGMSVLLPPEATSVRVRVCFADYVPEAQAAEQEEGKPPKRGRPQIHWRRQARGPIELTVALDASLEDTQGIRIEDTGLRLFGHIDTPDHIDGLPQGTRALSLFLVNARAPATDKHTRDAKYAFQAALELRCPEGLLARPDLASQAATDWDDQVMDLQFRDHAAYASGHGVAVSPIEEGGRVLGARTEWIPEAKVKRVAVGKIEGIELSMEKLAALESPNAVREALGAIHTQYGKWLGEQRSLLEGLGRKRREVAELVIARAERARSRIREGIELLAENADARRAFAMANRAMAMAARQRSPERYESGEEPSWFPFQIAFVLLNLPGVVDQKHDDRDTVELIYFPTGGGKTEAYLGTIAFTLLWRRLTGARRPDKGLGVAVILRYTLRLLTLDQLGRAATLICALEVLRAEHADLGDVRFSIGLWVGKSATANRLSEVARQVSDYKNGVTNLSPFPLPSCPWCHRPITSGDMRLEPNQKDAVSIEVGCGDFKCSFSAKAGGLPVVFVDEQIYRELPSFVVATVDKFAMIPWRGESGALFGLATARVDRYFVGPCTPKPKAVKGDVVHLPEGLRPPELIVQDELHLISGPLGTMVGLYETAIETLATRTLPDGSKVRPKILASTATVKRAVQQITALYGREDMAMFPPSGIDDAESFFATVDKNAHGRIYVGVGAAGRSTKAVLVTVYAALMAATEKCKNTAGDGSMAADPYMTLVGYFNNLRELGGTRRLAEDLVRARTATRGQLRPVGTAENPWMDDRQLDQDPFELTSRESTRAITKTKDRLSKGFRHDDFIPIVLASNMISVGVDIDRLGLMVVAGQPKSTSEYIQASSRVGRDDRRPGLVVTCYNLNKPRDRSHYEHFRDYHESFYRRVEATSVTPFSSPALERGLAGCLVSMTRHGTVDMTPSAAAMHLNAQAVAKSPGVQALLDRAQAQPTVGEHNEDVRKELSQRIQALIDTWVTLIANAKAGGGEKCYSPYDPDRAGVPILHTALDERLHLQKDIGPSEGFVAPTSMRDVEPTVHLWLKPAGWKPGVRS
jgi:hypothetical protein